MRTPLALAALLALAAPLPALAQLDDISGAAEEAASQLSDAAADKLLLADMIGLEITGPNGDTVGTVEDLVAVPGGKLVAAVIRLGPANDAEVEDDEPPADGSSDGSDAASADGAGDDGDEFIVVPYRVLKIDTAAEALGVSLPVPVEELQGPAMEALSDALGL